MNHLAELNWVSISQAMVASLLSSDLLGTEQVIGATVTAAAAAVIAGNI
jgi:hypothetical protein